MCRAKLGPRCQACTQVAGGATASIVKASTDTLEARQPWRFGLLLHFFAHLGMAADASPTIPSLGRVHHHTLYFAHFAPGISVGELLGVVTHQNT